MYEFDFYLSKLLQLNAASATLYRDLGKVLPDEHRPKAEEGLACISTKVDVKALKDADIWEITKRWRNFSFLRDLYTDGGLFEEYENFRHCSSYWPNLSPGTGIPLMKPADAHGGIKTTHTKQDRFFDHGFKGIFHKSVVLHSMAIGCLQFARRAIDLPVDFADLDLDDDPDADSDAQRFEHVVIGLWKKFGIAFYGGFSGQYLELPLLAKIDCLETFDFLYAFLLPKILPFEGLASWIENDAGQYPYNDDVLAQQQFGIDEWHAFLDLSRWVLQPDDLVELIENKAWTGTYPADRSMYMQTRAVFERGERGSGFRIICDREQMVKDLRNSPGFVLEDAEDQCWWDHLRVHCGSIYLAESLSKYREDLEKLKAMEGRAFGQGPTAAYQASRGAVPIFQ